MLQMPNQTNHSHLRAQQRCIADECFALIYSFGDIELPQHQGCRSLQLSRQMVASLLAEGKNLKVVDSASRTVLIVNKADEIVTPIKYQDAHRRTHRSRRRARR